jgi:hypothetical protein
MTATTDTRPVPGSLRPGLGVALVVAGVLLLAAALFMVLSISDRDGAADDVVHERQELAAQQLALQDAKDQLIAARSAAAATSNAFKQVVALERQLADTMAQGVDADKTAQSLGASDTPDVASYNAAIDQANALADQYNATIEQIRQLIAAIPKQAVGAR